MPDNPKTLLILGGTSDIGRATALTFAKHGWTIQLAGRNTEGLQREVGDITARTGMPVSAHIFDVLQTGSFQLFVEGLPTLPDIVVCVVGLLGDQARAETDLAHAATVMQLNYNGPSLILGLFAERFLARGGGTIVGVSSVAGDRGRASNYVYGSAKAGFSAFLSGLRNRLVKGGVHVVTVKPGFVKTKMTEHLTLPSNLTAAPQDVAAAIFRAVVHKTDVVYISTVWRLIMFVIRIIPERIFKKMNL
jgi:short-subunit dehydrogenase